MEESLKGETVMALAEMILPISDMVIAYRQALVRGGVHEQAADAMALQVHGLALSAMAGMFERSMKEM